MNFIYHDQGNWHHDHRINHPQGLTAIKGVEGIYRDVLIGTGLMK